MRRSRAASTNAITQMRLLENVMKAFQLSLGSLLLLVTIACGSESSPASPSPAPAPGPAPSGPSTAVSIPVGAARLTTTAFSPDLADVQVGTTITWTNSDSVPHTSTSDQNGWDSGTVAPGGRFAFTFQNAGTFSYHCTIHPGM